MHQEEVSCFKFECNTKETQTEITFESVVTCIEKVAFGVQCCIETLSNQQNVSEAEVSEIESKPCKDSNDSDDAGDANTTPKP